MKIDITPSLSIFNTYKNFGYKLPSALFEYFDNSTSSFFENGKKTDERYIITLVDRRDKEKTKLSIIDNAFGMNEEDFIRAIKIDNKMKKSGRNKFGVGLKVSAIWFSDIWSVESLEHKGDSYRKFVFDLKEIQNSNGTEFDASVSNKNYIGDEYWLDFKHGTIITLENPRDIPVNKNSVITLVNNISKQFQHDIEKENVKFLLAEITENKNGSIEFIDLVEKYFSEKESKFIRQRLTSCTPISPEKIIWKKINGYDEVVEINIDVFDPNNKKEMYTITGKVGWIENSGVGKGGFKRLWKNRALENNLWKPEEVLGKPNGYIAQRMYGELNFDHFEPTNSKDGFIIDSDLEFAIIEELSKALKKLKATINKVSKDDAKKKKTNNIKNVQKSFSKNADTVFDKEANIAYKAKISDVEDAMKKNGLFRVSGKDVRIEIALSPDFTNNNLIDLYSSDDKDFVYKFKINAKHNLIELAAQENLDNIMRMIYLTCYSEVVARVNFAAKNHFEAMFHIKNLNENFFTEDENE